jgi:hypothetical protein
MTHLSDDLLNETLDLALAPEVRAKAEAHLAVCELCSARLAELRTLFAELDTLPDLPLEMDFAPSVIARLEQTAPLPRPIRWLAVAQAFGAVLAIILTWPLVEPLLLSIKFPSLNAIFDKLTDSWLQIVTAFRFPNIAFELPSLDLPSTTLTIATLSVALLWLVANGLLLNPRSRRTQ